MRLFSTVPSLLNHLCKSLMIHNVSEMALHSPNFLSNCENNQKLSSILSIFEKICFSSVQCTIVETFRSIERL